MAWGESTCARGTLSGSWTPKVMLYMMDSAKSTGSWLTMDTCKALAPGQALPGSELQMPICAGRPEEQLENVNPLQWQHQESGHKESEVRCVNG